MYRIQNQVNIFLLFNVDNDVYALHTKRVLRIFSGRKVKNISNNPEYLCGSVRHGKNIMPIIDMFRVFTRKKNKTGNDKIIICTEIASESVFINVGLLVDSLIGVVHVHENEIVPYVDNCSLIEDCIKGVVYNGDTIIKVIDIDNITNSINANMLKKTLNYDEKYLKSICL